MAHAQPNATEAPPAPTGIVGRLRALITGRPLWQKIALAGLLVAVIGAAAYVSLSGGESEAASQHTLEEALHALEEGHYEEAGHLASVLAAEGHLPYDERGGPAYIHGILAVHQAEEIPYPDEQRRMYLVAARYLDSAYHQEYPAAMETAGLVLTGQCWHDAGRYARALPYLTQALKRRPRDASRIHRLLASSYYRDSNPQLKPALEHIEKFLAHRPLEPAERDAGVVEQARILIDQGRGEEAAAALAAVPADSPVASAVNVLQARLLMQQADAAAKTAPEDAKQQWQAAIELLRAPMGQEPAAVQAGREAQYLIGVCFLKLEDPRAAENQFSRARRINIGLPEGTAAAIEEADLQRLNGKDESAIELYGDLMRELGDLRDYSNPWLPLDALRDRMLAAYRHYRDAEKFEVALKFLQTLAPLLTAPRVLELKAEVNRRWGDRLSATHHGAEGSDEGQRAAHRRYHDAAQNYYRLARQSRATPEYPGYLWSSGECYQLAQDYHRTARLMRMYLDQNEPLRRPDALLAIGQSELALNNLDAALAPLLELLRDDAKHPLAYRARLVLHDVYIEQNKFAEARAALIENLEHEALTPQSLEWRDSLFALAHLLYRQGLELEAASREQGVDSEDEETRKAGLKLLEQSSATFHEAIQKFTEALARYPTAPRAIEARYLLAECHRQAAKWPRKKMPGLTIETSRASLAREMHEQLTAAHAIYSQLIEELNERQDKQPLPRTQRDLLRNCYFLQADALFDLGKYREAIQAYSSASNRYQQRPESLEAFVQIASCYRQLDEPAKARGTLEQAKVVLRRIPAEADFAETTRYSRDEWVTLLDFLTTM